MWMVFHDKLSFSQSYSVKIVSFLPPLSSFLLQRVQTQNHWKVSQDTEMLWRLDEQKPVGFNWIGCKLNFSWFRAALQQQADLRRYCNSFFLEVVSRFCLSEGQQPAEAVVELLFSLLVFASGPWGENRFTMEPLNVKSTCWTVVLFCIMQEIVTGPESSLHSCSVWTTVQWCDRCCQNCWCSTGEDRWREAWPRPELLLWQTQLPCRGDISMLKKT